MNLNQILNMALRLLMRRAVNAGINAGINGASSLLQKSRAGQPVQTRRAAPEMGDDGFAPIHDPAEAARQADEARRRAEQRAIRQARRASKG